MVQNMDFGAFRSKDAKAHSENIKQITRQLLTDNNLDDIYWRITDVKILCDPGRMPGGISKWYKSMKANEWEHWTL